MKKKKRKGKRKYLNIDTKINGKKINDFVTREIEKIWIKFHWIWCLFDLIENKNVRYEIA